MESVQHSEDLFGSQDDTSLREAVGAAEAAQQNISLELEKSASPQNEESSEKEVCNTLEKETPDLVFSEDVNFGEHSEKETDALESEDQPDADAIDGPQAETEEGDILVETEADGSSVPEEAQRSLQSDKVSESPEERLSQFPFARVKQIMKLDPDVGILSAESIFLVTKAAELFLQTLAKDTSSHTLTSKKKTMGLRDVQAAIESIDSLMFLEGMMKIK